MKAFLSKPKKKRGHWCQGPILTPGAKMNEHQATFMNILWGVIPPPPLSFFPPLSALSDFVFSRPLIYFLVFISRSSTSLCLAAALLRTQSPLPRGVWSPSRPHSNQTCPKDFWSSPPKEHSALPQWVQELRILFLLSFISFCLFPCIHQLEKLG